MGKLRRRARKVCTTALLVCLDRPSTLAWYGVVMRRRIPTSCVRDAQNADVHFGSRSETMLFFAGAPKRATGLSTRTSAMAFVSRGRAARMTNLLLGGKSVRGDRKTQLQKSGGRDTVRAGNWAPVRFRIMPNNSLWKRERTCGGWAALSAAERRTRLRDRGGFRGEEGKQKGLGKVGGGGGAGGRRGLRTPSRALRRSSRQRRRLGRGGGARKDGGSLAFGVLASSRGGGG